VRTSPSIERLAQRVGSAEFLDRPAAALGGALRRIVRRGAVEDTLTGTTLGHPLHPVLVGFPIGSWGAATVLDLVRADPASRRRLVGLGLLAAVPTASAGAADWLSTDGAARRIGLVHAASNTAVLVLQAASWLTRRRGRHARATVLSLTAMGFVGAGIWLGQQLVYALGIGVDNTVFQHPPEVWTDAAAEDDVRVDGALTVEVDAVPVLLSRVDDAIVALADTCTHRGGPLHEGRVADGCVTCPWHASTFDLRTGYVVSGLASRPEPRFEVQTADGRVRIRATRTSLRAG
jgi:nitrite reductase/ring-hydroxylating ferredoxin subunit/uncharacterized membrane protein